MNDLHIFAATGAEAGALKRALKPPSFGLRAKGEIDQARDHCMPTLHVTGIGPHAARKCALSVRESFHSDKKPGTIIIIGACGSLSPNLPEQEVVLYRSCLSASQEQELPCSEALIQCLSRGLAAGGVTHALVKGIASGRIATTKPEKLQLAELGAEVVDMESYQILEVMAPAGVACAVLRVVSDSLDREFPDFNPALRGDGKVDRLTAARIACRSPFETIRWALAGHKAIRKLQLALRAALDSSCLFEKRDQRT
jgi:nucleoside phosphorylase